MADMKATARLIAKHNQVATLNKELKALGERQAHSCYVCNDDWPFERRRCYDRQRNALEIQLLVAVSDLVVEDTEAKFEPLKSAK